MSETEKGTSDLISLHPRTFASVVVALVVGLGGGAGAAGAITTSSASALTTEIRLSRAELSGKLDLLAQRLGSVESATARELAALEARIAKLEEAAGRRR